MVRLAVALSGSVVAVAGWYLTKRFGERAKRSGIGSFTLLPLAGIAYVTGQLCIILGLLAVCFALFA